jgi:hypothetical protein
MNAEFHGLMPRIGGRDNKIPVSRDYKLVISCENTRCPINKLSFCSMASAIKINSAGKCKTGSDLIEEMKDKKKEDLGFYKYEGD